MVETGQTADLTMIILLAILTGLVLVALAVRLISSRAAQHDPGRSHTSETHQVHPTDDTIPKTLVNGLPPITDDTKTGSEPASLISAPTALRTDVSPSPDRDQSADVLAPAPPGARSVFGAFEDPRLDDARMVLDAGDTEKASEILRDVVGEAMQKKKNVSHAQARLLLAELCIAREDLTSACEHWQMARELYQQAGTESQLGQIEYLMREHGCPTDWVLNDF